MCHRQQAAPPTRPRSGPRHKGTAPPRAKGKAATPGALVTSSVQGHKARPRFTSTGTGQGRNHGPQPARPIRAAAHTSAGRVAPGKRLRGCFPFVLKTERLGPKGTRPQPRRKARQPGHQTARPRLPPRPPSNAASTSTRASLALFLVPFCAKPPTTAKRKEEKEKQEREEKSIYISYSDNSSLMPPLCPQLAPNLPPKISIAKNPLLAISF